jgi:predicted HD superfamily hydrolase involved in NAD metabolism
MIYTEEQLSKLKDKVKQNMGESRFAHTLSVEKEVVKMAALYLPESVSELRAAAILHDLTKCYRREEQVALCESLGIALGEYERRTPEVLHGISAVKIIERDYPEFATPCILEAIRVHTTGDVGMSIFSLILFVADFIEEGRPYPDCKNLRHKYWDMTQADHTLYPLRYAALQELRSTVAYLKREKLLVAPKTFEAIKDLEKLLECEDLSCQ